MITEDYVSFDTAKLLKEKGFDICCEFQYINCLSGHPFLTDIRDDAGCYYKNSEIGQDEYSAPTLQMAMKWLREVHNILVSPYALRPGYYFEIFDLTNRDISGCKPLYKVGIPRNEDVLNTYEEACEAAIKYCLENLI